MNAINVEISPDDVIKAKAKKPDTRWVTVYQIPLTLFTLNKCEFTVEALFTRDGQFFDSVFIADIFNCGDDDISIGGMYQ